MTLINIYKKRSVCWLRIFELMFFELHVPLGCGEIVGREEKIWC